MEDGDTGWISGWTPKFRKAKNLKIWTQFWLQIAKRSLEEENKLGIETCNDRILICLMKEWILQEDHPYTTESSVHWEMRMPLQDLLLFLLTWLQQNLLN